MTLGTKSLLVLFINMQLFFFLYFTVEIRELLSISAEVF
jgi:hypothetical protein